MQNKVLIITHGKFGIELKASVEMIMGEQEHVDALGLLPGQSVDDLKAEAFELIEKNEAAGYRTIVMCDLMGGSPSNVALGCMGKADCEVVLGVSMPMLVEAIQMLDDEQEASALAEDAMEVAKEGILHFNRSLIKK